MHGTPKGMSVVSGTYREIVPPERLVFTWAWEEDVSTHRAGHESIVTVTLRAVGGRTELTLRHERLESDFVPRQPRPGLERLPRQARHPISPSRRRESKHDRTHLYGIPQSTYVRSARMACIEKGVPYTLEPSMPRSDTIRQLHPFARCRCCVTATSRSTRRAPSCAMSTKPSTGRRFSPRSRAGAP